MTYQQAIKCQFCNGTGELKQISHFTVCDFCIKESLVLYDRKLRLWMQILDGE